MSLAIQNEVSWWSDSERLRDGGIAVLVGIVALVLRLVGAATREASLGEMAASVAVTTDFWTVFTGPLSEQCPPVLWAVLWPVSSLSGGALEILRCWVAFLSALACASVYPAFRGILKPGGAALAAFVLAVHPAAVLAGRTVGPEALVLPAFLLAIYGMIRAVEENRLRDWLLLDLGLILLLTSHRGAMVAAGGLLLVHLGLIIHRVAHRERKAWEPRKKELLQSLGVHYALTAVISLPLAVVILRNPMFPVEAFDGLALGNWWNSTLFAGADGTRSWVGSAMVALGWLLVVPGLLAVPFVGGWRLVAAMAWVLATLVTVIAVSLAPGGFKFSGVDLAGLTVGGVALSLGAALGHVTSRALPLTVGGLLGLGWMLNGIPADTPELPIRAAMNRVKEIRQPGEPILVWPPYLEIGLRYYMGAEVGDGDLAEYLTGISEAPEDRRVHVALVRWPENSARTITLRGALKLHSSEAEIWKAGALGEVISVREMDRQRMAAWNADPRTLDTDDKPVPRLTMHMWVPTDDLFAKSKQFHSEPAEALFEPSGRRVAWTNSEEEVSLEPKVNLPQGSYFVKVHCAPSPEDGPGRELEVVVSAFERKKFRVTEESTLSVPFTTATDLQVLPIRIGAKPLMTAGTGRFQRRQGLKIYSISVEPTTPFK
jgi:hypothetical protein